MSGHEGSSRNKAFKFHIVKQLQLNPRERRAASQAEHSNVQVKHRQALSLAPEASSMGRGRRLSVSPSTQAALWMLLFWKHSQV